MKKRMQGVRVDDEKEFDDKSWVEVVVVKRKKIAGFKKKLCLGGSTMSVRPCFNRLALLPGRQLHRQRRAVTRDPPVSRLGADCQRTLLPPPSHLLKCVK